MNWSVSPPVLCGDHQSLIFCVVFCSPLFVLIVFVLFPLAIVLFILSLMASDYLFVIFKLFLAYKSTTETRGSKVINRVCFVFVCGCSFFIQCWWMLSSLYFSFKSQCNMLMILSVCYCSQDTRGWNWTEIQSFQKVPFFQCIPYIIFYLGI